MRDSVHTAVERASSCAGRLHKTMKRLETGQRVHAKGEREKRERERGIERERGDIGDIGVTYRAHPKAREQRHNIYIPVHSK